MHNYMINMTIRFLLSGLYVLFILKKGISNQFSFTILFMFMYFFHLLFELKYLLTNLRAVTKERGV